MSNATPIRAGFVAAGNRSVSHMAALTHLENIAVAGITELDPARAAAAVARANERRAPGSDPIQPKVFDNVQAMMDATGCNVLYLCLPPYAHGKLDHQIIDMGLPVMFEKPVAVEMGVANEIAAHVAESGIVNAAGYQKRYGAPVQAAKTRLAGLPIGMAIAIRLSGLPGQPWWRVQAQSGGMLVEQHTHAVDLMRLLVGEIESAYAVGGTFFLKETPHLDIFDMNAATVRFAGGIPGIIGNSCAAPEGAPVFPPHLVHVVAKGMTVSVNQSKATFRTQEGEEEVLPTEDDDLPMNRAFIAAARRGDQEGILSDFADATRTLAVTLACQRSAETGRPVQLAEFMAV
ncbi:MAG: Gfo/Idh/MocA family oxidoreductase [Caldilineaceae bacterium]|nr:Gfo/Idh/MocA family oxidoreductase [Caldilineaceae bacterium]